MLVSIISSASGPMMDGDISWVMDLLISQLCFVVFFFFLCFMCESGLGRKSNACLPFGFVQELSKS